MRFTPWSDENARPLNTFPIGTGIALNSADSGRLPDLFNAFQGKQGSGLDVERPGDGSCELLKTSELKDQVATTSCSWSCFDRPSGIRREK